MRCLGFRRLALHVQRTHLAGNRRAALVQVAPLNREQLTLNHALLCLQLGVLFRRTSLSIQMR